MSDNEEIRPDEDISKTVEPITHLVKPDGSRVPVRITLSAIDALKQAEREINQPGQPDPKKN
jgi:hypothetical protein